MSHFVMRSRLMTLKSPSLLKYHVDVIDPGVCVADAAHAAASVNLLRHQYRAVTRS